ncbi:MAG: hypothetical protein ACRD0J_17955 [Acidimicrobiales bacterium]
MEKLGYYEGSTIDELAGPRGLKRIPVDHLGATAKRRLGELDLDDYDSLWELHLTGKQRLWAVRDGPVLALLWWDPNHQVCPSHKKHT